MPRRGSGTAKAGNPSRSMPATACGSTCPWPLCQAAIGAPGRAPARSPCRPRTSTCARPARNLEPAYRPEKAASVRSPHLLRLPHGKAGAALALRARPGCAARPRGRLLQIRERLAKSGLNNASSGSRAFCPPPARHPQPIPDPSSERLVDLIPRPPPRLSWSPRPMAVRQGSLCRLTWPRVLETDQADHPRGVPDHSVRCCRQLGEQVFHFPLLVASKRRQQGARLRTMGLSERFWTRPFAAAGDFVFCALLPASATFKATALALFLPRLRHLDPNHTIQIRRRIPPDGIVLAPDEIEMKRPTRVFCEQSRLHPGDLHLQSL